MASVISSRYRENRGGEKTIMHDNVSMEVVGYVNETSYVARLKKDSILHIAYIGVLRGVGKTIAISIDLKITTKHICASLTNH